MKQQGCSPQTPLSLWAQADWKLLLGSESIGGPVWDALSKLNTFVLGEVEVEVDAVFFFIII